YVAVAVYILSMASGCATSAQAYLGMTSAEGARSAPSKDACDPSWDAVRLARGVLPCRPLWCTWTPTADACIEDGRAFTCGLTSVSGHDEALASLKRHGYRIDGMHSTWHGCKVVKVFHHPAIVNHFQDVRRDKRKPMVYLGLWKCCETPRDCIEA